jgi:hypothetical protein
VIRRDDAVKEQILRPMFGEDWAAERRFPDTAIADGETLRLDGIALRATDLGPGESPHDSIWTLAGDDRTVFTADVAYDRKHGYLADGFHAEWLANIGRLRRELPRTCRRTSCGSWSSSASSRWRGSSAPWADLPGGGVAELDARRQLADDGDPIDVVGDRGGAGPARRGGDVDGHLRPPFWIDRSLTSGRRTHHPSHHRSVARAVAAR